MNPLVALISKAFDERVLQVHERDGGFALYVKVFGMGVQVAWLSLLEYQRMMAA